MTDEHTDRLDACYRNLARVDQWIQNADGKAAALLTAEALLFGLGVATLSDQVSALLRGGSPGKMAAALAFVAGVVLFAISLYQVLGVLVPNIREREESLFFFGSVAALSRGEFERRMHELTPEAIERDIVRQIHTNSAIAARKFGRLHSASVALIWSLGSTLLFLILKGVADP